MSRRTAILLVLLAATLFSTGGLLIKIISIGPLALVSGRSIIAAIVLTMWLKRPRFTWSLPQIGGAVALMATQLFFVLATRQTTAANAIFIQFTAPVYVALLGTWYLGEKAQRIDWFTIAAVATGFYLFFSDELTVTGFWGNIYAVLSGVTLAWLILFLRKQKDESIVETMLLGNILAGVVGLPFLLQSSPTVGDVGGILFLGVFQLGIPFVMMSTGVKYLAAVEIIILQTLEPILNPVWVFLVIGEVPSRLAFLGGIIVIVAITVRSLAISRPSRAETKMKTIG